MLQSKPPGGRLLPLSQNNKPGEKQRYRVKAEKRKGWKNKGRMEGRKGGWKAEN